MTDKYPEIKALQNFINNNSVFAFKSDVILVYENLIPMVLSIGEDSFTVQVEDEYGDIDFNKNELNVVLVLQALETVEYSTDYLDWCKELDLEANNDKLRSYYQEVCKLCYRIRDYFQKGQITSFISDMDIQLNAGAMQALRSEKY